MAVVSTPNRLGLHSLLKAPYQWLRGYPALNRRYEKPDDFYGRFIPPRALRQAVDAAGLELVTLTHGGFVFSFTPDWALGANLLAERAAEASAWLRRLAVSTFVLCRKRSDAAG